MLEILDNREDNNEIPFVELNNGDIFEYEHGLYMKTNMKGTGSSYTAINLSNGEVDFIYDTELVQEVNATLTIVGNL